MSEAYVAEEPLDPEAPAGAEAPLEDDSHLPVEERARIRGWKPLDQYHGDPRRWRSAEEFMHFGENDANVLREENRRLGGRVHRMDNQLQDLRKTAQEQLGAIRALTDLARRADEQGYQRARDELLAQRKQAVETGDTGAFDQIEAQIGALDKARQEAPAPEPAPKPAPPQFDPAITAFLADNADWFIPGSQLAKTMHAYLEIADQRYPERPIAQRLAIAKRQTMDEFPERFPGHMPQAEIEPELPEQEEVAPRRRAPTVAAPGLTPRRGPRAPTGWDAIEDLQERADAKAAFASIQRADAGMTEEEYLTLYNNPHADVLALRAQRKKA